MADDSKPRILARRAQFIAASLAGVAIAVSPTVARAADAAVDDAATDADADGAPPEPCLSIAREPEPEPCLCSIAPPDAAAITFGPAALAAAAVLAARRRKSRPD